MGAAADLETKLRAMSAPDFITFCEKLGLLAPQSERINIINAPPPEPVDIDFQIKRILAYEHNNPPFFSQILRAANIASDAERAERRGEQTSTAISEIAAQAKRANELSEAANRIAADANRKSEKARLTAWVSFATAVIALTAAVVGLIAALVKK